MPVPALSSPCCGENSDKHPAAILRRKTFSSGSQQETTRIDLVLSRRAELSDKHGHIVPQPSAVSIHCPDLETNSPLLGSLERVIGILGTSPIPKATTPSKCRGCGADATGGRLVEIGTAHRVSEGSDVACVAGKPTSQNANLPPLPARNTRTRRLHWQRALL